MEPERTPGRLTAEQARVLFAKARPTGRSGLRLTASACVLAQIAAGSSLGAKKRASARSAAWGDPQKILAVALRERLGDALVQEEVTGLIPGRRFRADIVIPSARLIIEFDGFQYHRSKTAFQGDRQRQNLFVLQGWRVLRVFARQVFAELDETVALVLRACADCRAP